MFKKKLKNVDKLHPVDYPAVISMKTKRTKKINLPIETIQQETKLFDDSIRKRRGKGTNDPLQKYRVYKSKVEPELYSHIVENEDKSVKDLLKDVINVIKKPSIQKIAKDTMTENPVFDTNEITKEGDLIKPSITGVDDKPPEDKSMVGMAMAGLKKHKSASIIQGALRGKLAIQDLAKQENSATKIQGAFREKKERDEKNKKIVEEAIKQAIGNVKNIENYVNENSASKKIQALYKDYLSRKSKLDDDTLSKTTTTKLGEVEGTKVKIINPETSRPIDKYGKTYKELIGKGYIEERGKLIKKLVIISDKPPPVPPRVRTPTGAKKTSKSSLPK